MVAKSYQKLEIIKEPYMVNGRMYVQVKLGNGMAKVVRWYSDKEYSRYYPGEKIDHSKDPFYKSQKEILGFKDGYITIFKGDTYSCKDWFKENGAKYTKYWGWSFASDVTLPENLPSGVEAIQLKWEDVGKDEELLTETVVKKFIDSLMYEKDDSEYQGKIGERLEIVVSVEKAIPLNNGYYGPSICYTMRDYDGNCYVWITSSKKSLSVDEEYAIRGTVKKHSDFKGIKQTVLTRCSIINK